VNADELQRASRLEQQLWAELADAYRGLAAVLDEGREAVEPDLVATHEQRAEMAVRALRPLAAALAPYRLSGAAVAPEVRECWRTSAALAAEASEANTRLAARARTRQEALAGRLARLAEGRQALAGYRPPGSASRGQLRG
jgi:hypothetical protein